MVGVPLLPVGAGRTGQRRGEGGVVVMVLVLIALVVLAAVDGAWLEALGLAVFALVVAGLVSRGVGERPRPFTIWFPGGRWRR